MCASEWSRQPSTEKIYSLLSSGRPSRNFRFKLKPSACHSKGYSDWPCLPTMTVPWTILTIWIHITCWSCFRRKWKKICWRSWKFWWRGIWRYAGTAISGDILTRCIRNPSTNTQILCSTSTTSTSSCSSRWYLWLRDQDLGCASLLSRTSLRKEGGGLNFCIIFVMMKNFLSWRNFYWVSMSKYPRLSVPLYTWVSQNWMKLSWPTI